jgi:cell division topological specificity factor
MSSFLERLKGRKEPSSAEIAKERLKLVLVADRSNLSPEKLAEMQTEIIEVIKRYIPLDAMDVEIKFEQRDRKNYLVADIPLQRARGDVLLTLTPEDMASTMSDYVQESTGPAEEADPGQPADATPDTPDPSG